MQWTKEQKLEVGRLASEGLSATQIMSIFKLSSPGAITGLAKRNPDIITLRGSHGGGPPKGMRMPRKRKPVQTAAFLLKSSPQPDMKCQALPPEPEIWEDCEQITLLELTDATCKWPIGSRDYVFCGRRVQAGLPYCGPHCRISYLPREPRRHR
jgi:GcrA cell cycle regulator